MIYRELIKTGIKVSAISMGCAGIGHDYPPGQKGIYGKAAGALLGKALKAGINLFDTAIDYGESERIVGELLGGENVYLATKIPATGYTDLETECLLPRIDILQFRGIPNGVKIETEAKRPRFWGVSAYATFEADSVCESLSNLQVSQFPFNLLDRRFERFFGKIGTIARSPLLRGKLASMDEEAMRFSLFGGADTTLLGIASERDLDFALECLEKGPIDYEAIIDPRRW